jgi:hypothetical protein
VRIAFLLVFLLSTSRAIGADFTADFEIENVDKDFIMRSDSDPTRLDLNEYYSTKPPAVHFLEPADIKDCTLDDKPCDATKMISLKLSQNEYCAHPFRLRYVRNDQPHLFTVVVLGSQFPHYQVIGQSAINDLILLSPFALDSPTSANESKGTLLAIDPKGGVYFYRRYPHIVADFRPHQFGQTRIYSYLKAKRGIQALTIEGERVILNSQFQPLRTLHDASDLHEFLMLGPEHTINLISRKVRTPMGGCMLGNEISEKKRGKIIFQMNTADLLKQGLTFPDFRLSAFAYDGEICQDIFHLNAIQILGKDKWLLGFARSVVMYDKKRKKVEWVFGGADSMFPVPEYLQAVFMHTAHWREDRQELTFFKNSSSTTAGSQAYEVALDVKNRKVKSVKEVFKNLHISSGMGSVQKTGDLVYSVYLGNKLNPEDIDFTEMSDGKAAFMLRFFEPFNAGYRAYRTPK